MLLEPDRDQIEIFVDAVFRHAGEQGFVAVRSFLEDDDKPFRLSGVALASGLKFLIDVAEDDARRAAQHPKPVVFCPPLAIFSSKDRAREQDIAAGLALSVECDEHPQEARAALEQLLGPATVVVKSGGRWVNGGREPADKLHLHWRLVEPAEGADLARLKQARDFAARIVGGDPSNKPVCHPIRWPGSWHRKSEPRLCEIETLEADREIDLDAALATLTAAAPADAGTSSEDWAELVSDIITGRSFHGPLVSLAARLVGSQMHDGTAVKLLRALMLTTAATHDEQRWQSRFDSIPRIVASARDKFGGRQEGPKEEIALHWHADISEAIITRPWLVDGLLPETGTGLVSGQWGTYKSFVALDLAAAVMAGLTFIDYPVIRRGGVLYIAMEGAFDIPTRLKAVFAEKYPGAGALPFAWIEDCPALLNPRAVEILAAVAHKANARMQADFGVPLGLVVFDTLVDCAGYIKAGDENDAAVNQIIQNRLAALSRLTGALVLGIDHFGKAVETGTRGSSAKEARADVVLALLADKSVSGEVTNTMLAVRKNRSGPSGREHAFTVRAVDLGTDQHGRAVTSLVIDWGRLEGNPMGGDKDGWSKSLRLLRRALMNVLVDQGEERRPFPDGPLVRTVEIEIVRAEFYKSYMADGDAKSKQASRRQAFHRAIRNAQDRSLIGLREIGETTYVWLARNEGSPPPDA